MAIKKTTSLYSKSVKHATKSFRFCKMVYAGNFLVVGVFLCTRTNLLFAQDLDTKNLTFKPQESSTSKSNNIPPDCPTSTWTYVGIAIGIVIAFGLIGNLILRYLEHKWKRMDYQVGRFFRGSLNPDCISLTEANNQEQLEMESAVNTKYRLPRSKIYNGMFCTEYYAYRYTIQYLTDYCVSRLATCFGRRSFGYRLQNNRQNISNG